MTTENTRFNLDTMPDGSPVPDGWAVTVISEHDEDYGFLAHLGDNAPGNGRCHPRSAGGRRTYAVHHSEPYLLWTASGDARGCLTRIPGDSRNPGGLGEDAWLYVPPSYTREERAAVVDATRRAACGELAPCYVRVECKGPHGATWEDGIGGFDVGDYGTNRKDLTEAARDILCGFRPAAALDERRAALVAEVARATATLAEMGGAS